MRDSPTPNTCRYWTKILDSQ